jgi:hypothetical protein
VTEAFFDEETCSVRSAALDLSSITTAPVPMPPPAGLRVHFRAFFPYFETGIRDHADPLLSVYFELLRRHTHHIMERLIAVGFFTKNPILPDDLLQTVMSQSKTDKQLNDLDSLMPAFDLADPKNALLRDLRRALTKADDSDFVDFSSSVMTSVQSSLSSDRLFLNSFRERILAPCLWTAVENCQSCSVLKVVALVNTKERVSTVQGVLRVIKKSCGGVQATCVVVDGSSRKHELEDVDVVHVGHLGDASRLLEDADLVVCINCLSRLGDVGEALAVVQSCLKADAFVLLMEPSCTLLIPFVIFLFDPCQQPVHDAFNRTCGPFCDDSSWVRQLAAAGLETVSQKSDSFIFTLFLCKKIQSNPHSLQDIYKSSIEVSNNDFTWISKLEKSLKENDGTIWVKKAGNFHTGLDRLLHLYMQKSEKNRIK